MLNTEILNELRLGQPYPLPTGPALLMPRRRLLKSHGPHLASPHAMDEGVIFPMRRPQD